MDIYNLNARELANKVGIQASSISHVLTGRNKPSIEFLEKLLKVFPETDIHWLITGVKKEAQIKKTEPEIFSFGLMSSKSSSDEGVAENALTEFQNDGAGSKDRDQIIVLHSDGTFQRYVSR